MSSVSLQGPSSGVAFSSPAVYTRGRWGGKRGHDDAVVKCESGV